MPTSLDRQMEELITQYNKSLTQIKLYRSTLRSIIPVDLKQKQLIESCLKYTPACTSDK